MRTTTLFVALMLVLFFGCSKDNSTNTTVDQVLHAPTGLTATVVGKSAVRLNWTDNAEIEEGYVVERRVGLGSFGQQIFTAQNVSTAIDSLGLLPGASYSYRVRAIRYGERGDYSDLATVQMPAQ